MSGLRSNHVFINCPFDRAYKPIFDAIVFAIRRLGFVARCALEVDDGSEARISKIENIIEECRFGVHDISKVTIDANTGLPRFNMPLELGLFLGCKRFGGDAQRQKACIILDSDPYRYRTFISDIAGHDIHSHGGSPEGAIRETRNWLAAVSKRKMLVGSAEIVKKYLRFMTDLPAFCAKLHRQPEDLIFVDLSEVIGKWLQENR